MFRDPWPEGFDAILLSHFVELFTPEKIESIYSKAYEVLPAGGLFSPLPAVKAWHIRAAIMSDGCITWALAI